MNNPDPEPPTPPQGQPPVVARTLPWAPSPRQNGGWPAPGDRPNGGVQPGPPAAPGLSENAGTGASDLGSTARQNGARGVLETRDVSCWFGNAKVLERVSLVMRPQQVTALIGPSGCGKSTFLRVLNRMHELVPSARLSGQVFLDGDDIYGKGVRVTDTRLRVGMVFQKPNPFPSMTIAQNVLAGLRLAGLHVKNRDALVQECLTRAGLWRETRNRLNGPGGALSGGQQQRLCIARALAVRPEVLLMDEPCSALDPISTGVIEQTIAELKQEITIVIVTHNMQQAQRVSERCALFLVDGEGEPGHIVEQGQTSQLFGSPRDPRTADYVGGRFG